MSKLQNLQNAARNAAGKAPARKVAAAPAAVAAKPAPAAVPAPAAPEAPKPNSRAGKIALTFHLPEDFKRSLRLVQAHRGSGCTMEQLAAEAFNDLFGKYDVPTVQTGKE
jgi:uncharacterized membrane protein